MQRPTVLYSCWPALQAAQLQSLRSSQQLSWVTNKPHVLLELMLLHADPPSMCPAGLQPTAASYQSMALGSSFDGVQVNAGGAGNEQGLSPPAVAPTAALGSGGQGSEGDTELHVWVSAASNVPLVPG